MNTVHIIYMNLPSTSVTITNVYVLVLSYFLANSFCTKGNKDSTNEIYVTVSNSLSMKPNSKIQKWFVLAINTFITSFFLLMYDLAFQSIFHLTSTTYQHCRFKANFIFFNCDLNCVSQTKKDIQFHIFRIYSTSQMGRSRC